MLELTDGKYYIGITSKTVEERFEEHKRGGYYDHAASWTKKYKPVKVSFSRNLGAVSEIEAVASENKLTREYIKKYGFDNVRGGDLANPEYAEYKGYVYGSKNEVRLVKIASIFAVLTFILAVILFFILWY